MLDSKIEWNNLVQTDTVLQYYREFEKIRVKVRCSEQFVVSFFIGGLREEIKVYVKERKPRMLDDAYGLALLQELLLAYNNISSNDPPYCT